MTSPDGTPSTYSEIGSLNRILPWSTSWRIAVTVNVLVTLPMRVWSSRAIGAPVAVSAKTTGFHPRVEPFNLGSPSGATLSRVLAA